MAETFHAPAGVIYVAFGDNAIKAMTSSVMSLRLLCPELPIVVIGKEPLWVTTHQESMYWDGENPYRPTNPNQFHFLAGRVKPFLYGISPFDKTLYVDADTEFQSSPMPGFDLLNRYDFMVAKHSSHNIGMLGEHPSPERLETMKELGGCGDIPYPNSGVLFWKKCPASELLFQSWHTEWMRFQGWDEQLALMRATYKHPIRWLLLPEAWNGENRKEGSIIFHDFHGTHIARSNAG